MNKSELVDAVASKADVGRSQAENVLNAFFDTVQNEARSGNKVSWPGFGSFSTSQRAARTGRNPQTGAPVKIAASTAMKFSAASGLKDFLNSRGGAGGGGGGGAKKSAAKKSAPAKKSGGGGAKKAGAKKAAKKR